MHPAKNCYKMQNIRRHLPYSSLTFVNFAKTSFLSILKKSSCRIFFIAFIGLFTTVLCKAQSASPTAAQQKTVHKDTLIPKKELWQPIPKKAGLYAALVPGLGQIYNRQYWKLPIVYGGLSVAGYFIVRNTKDYNSLRSAYISRLSEGNGPYTDEYANVYRTTEQVRQLQDDANRLLNLTIVFSTVAYVVQVMDAITAAHLRNFDISRDISLHVRPVVTPVGAGMGLVMNF